MYVMNPTLIVPKENATMAFELAKSVDYEGTDKNDKKKLLAYYKQMPVDTIISLRPDSVHQKVRKVISDLNISVVKMLHFDSKMMHRYFLHLYLHIFSNKEEIRFYHRRLKKWHRRPVEYPFSLDFAIKKQRWRFFVSYTFSTRIGNLLLGRRIRLERGNCPTSS